MNAKLFSKLKNKVVSLSTGFPELVDLPPCCTFDRIKTLFSSMVYRSAISKFVGSEFPKSFVQLFEGPTNKSNWVIPKRLLMSAYPGKSLYGKFNISRRYGSR